MSQARFEEICKKYQEVKWEKSDYDPLTLKQEIDSYIKNSKVSDEKNEDLLVKAQDMLIDLIKIIEEGHCQPFKPKRL